MKRNPYPHVFQPITIRGLTLKNRLEYSPTVVLKCNAPHRRRLGDGGRHPCNP